MNEVSKFEIRISDDDLRDLRDRLERTRWPEQETSSGWEQGVPLDYARKVHAYWLDEYSWRDREALHNRYPQFMTDIHGLPIHFVHLESPHTDAVPLLLSHGWPGSVFEFSKVMEPLVDPERFGGEAKDAFHVVSPSLPGYGFSEKPERSGWGVEKIADAWDSLMLRLGYTRYFAQGGDWGSAVTTQIAIANKGHCTGIHLNMVNARPTREAIENPTPQDERVLTTGKRHQKQGTGYSWIQSTKPQTLGYALADSPMGQAMWITEKFYEWTDCGGDLESVIPLDELLDNIMLYWLTSSGASSARLYWESFPRAFAGIYAVEVPMGGSIFPKDIVATPRSWAEAHFSNIVYWNELEEGGHFAALEQPEQFVSELRDCFRLMRQVPC